MFREAFVQEKQRLVENAPSLASGSAGSVLASALNSKEQAGSNPIGRNSTENELGSKPYSRGGLSLCDQVHCLWKKTHEGLSVTSRRPF